MMILFNVFSFCDVPEMWQLGFQDSATPVVQGMHEFYNYLMFFCILIGISVFFVLFVVIFKFRNDSPTKLERFTHSSILEITWTIIPAVLLLFIAVPSFSLLYSLDELINPSLTLKIIGHQWYWTYEYSDRSIFSPETTVNINFDSYMVNTADLPLGSFRLLEVDNRLILPINTHIRLLITSADVLHSWAVPSFGIKVDACPGRLSQASLFLQREGVFYGQCSEICGINHGFMPIVVKGVSENVFYLWQMMKAETLASAKEYFATPLKKVAKI